MSNKPDQQEKKQRDVCHKPRRTGPTILGSTVIGEVGIELQGCRSAELETARLHGRSRGFVSGDADHVSKRSTEEKENTKLII